MPLVVISSAICSGEAVVGDIGRLDISRVANAKSFDLILCLLLLFLLSCPDSYVVPSKTMRGINNPFCLGMRVRLGCLADHVHATHILLHVSSFTGVYAMH